MSPIVFLKKSKKHSAGPQVTCLLQLPFKDLDTSGTKLKHLGRQNLTMCCYTRQIFRCGHSEIQYQHGCPRTYDQLMRICNPSETGLPFDWSDDCRPRKENMKNVQVPRQCSRCHDRPRQRPSEERNRHDRTSNQT